jgi:hypothetical protein
MAIRCCLMCVAVPYSTRRRSCVGSRPRCSEGRIPCHSQNHDFIVRFCILYCSRSWANSRVECPGVNFHKFNHSFPPICCRQFTRSHGSPGHVDALEQQSHPCADACSCQRIPFSQPCPYTHDSCGSQPGSDDMHPLPCVCVCMHACMYVCMYECVFS